MNVLQFSSRLTTLGFRCVQCSRLPAVPFKVSGLYTQYSSAIKCNAKVHPPAASETPITTRSRWTNEETQQLFKAVELFTPPYPWQKIANHLQLGKSSGQCSEKYRSSKYNAWSEEKVTILCNLVAEAASNGQHNEEEVDWEIISKELGKTASACRKKWEKIQKPGIVERFLRTETTAWSAELVERLTESVRQFQGKRVDWSIVANDVGHGKNAMRCRAKYDYISVKASTRGDEQAADEVWSEEKVAMLHQLVELHTALNENSDYAATDWIAVGRGLGRRPYMCRKKWQDISLKQSNRNKEVRHYTPEEDALILRHVEEWGKDNKLGLWTSLEEKLGRRHVRVRWLSLRSGTDERLYWTEDMDNALIAVRKELLVSKTSSSKSIDVRSAERMTGLGWKVTAAQCRHRYYSVIQHRLNGYAVKATWTKELTASMMELRANGASWSEIGAALRISPSTCRLKHDTVLTAHLTRGPFSAEEDALVRQRVAEWGDPRQRSGLWVRLQKEMGRPASALRKRWQLSLSHKIAG